VLGQPSPAAAPLSVERAERVEAAALLAVPLMLPIKERAAAAHVLTAHPVAPKVGCVLRQVYTTARHCKVCE